MPKRAFLSPNVSSIIFSQISIIYKDLGCPTISIVKGDQLIQRVLLDFGASVNLFPFTVYEKLGLGELRPTKILL